MYHFSLKHEKHVGLLPQPLVFAETLLAKWPQRSVTVQGSCCDPPHAFCWSCAAARFPWPPSHERGAVASDW